MSGFLGADTARLRETSALFSQRTDLLQETGRHILHLVQAVTWVGPDADAFRAESASIADRLRQLAVRVGEQAATLRGQADQQDEVSSDAGGQGGAGAWRPDLDRLWDILPWPSAHPKGSGSWRDPVSDPWGLVDDKVRDAVLDAIDRVVDPSNPVWRGAKKVIPAIPELTGMVNDLLEGDTPGFIVGHARVLVSITPLGWIEDASSLIFPALPDDWTYPGTDIPLNEGSLLDGAESVFREGYESSEMWQMDDVREAEQWATEVSDQLGIENEYARNVFKTVAGTGAGIRAGTLDPVTGDEGDVWVFSAPVGRG